MFLSQRGDKKIPLFVEKIKALCYTVIMKVKVYAKLNLSLNVLGMKGEFHVIDSVVTSVDVFDVVEVRKRPDNAVNLAGCSNIPLETNTAYKTACAFMERFGSTGVDITITKNIPMGAGMGGSSADAAAVVYCMCKLFGADIRSPEIKQLCAEVGSDVNYMLHGGLARITGKGDDVEIIRNTEKLHFVVTTFDHANSTAQVYSAFDKLPAQTIVDNGELISAITTGKTDLPLINHLQPASASLSNYALAYLAFVKSMGHNTTITGSGSAYFILCKSNSDAEALYDKLNEQGFNSFTCQSVERGIEVAE